MRFSFNRGAAIGAILAVAVFGFARMGYAKDAKDAQVVSEAKQTVSVFKKTDPSLERFFHKSAGYVVFPGVGKGGLVVGGAHGTGVLFENGMAMGKATLNQVTVGAQVGGQEYAEVIFFETPATLAEFKAGKTAFSAQVSAVALSSGAAANAKYNHGVAVFTATKGGLMAEASLGGQKFSYEAF